MYLFTYFIKCGTLHPPLDLLTTWLEREKCNLEHSMDTFLNCLEKISPEQGVCHPVYSYEKRHVFQGNFFFNVRVYI